MTIQTFEDLYNFAKDNGLQKTKDLLRKYVEDEEIGELEEGKASFMPGFSTRAMCRCASMGLEGRPINDIPGTYMSTKHGSELFFYMWGGGKV